MPSRGWSGPAAWASTLPGDDGARLTAVWYAHRLGLVDASGRIAPRPGAQELHNALGMYLDAFLDCGGVGRAASFYRRRGDGDIGWAPPLRTVWPDDPDAGRDDDDRDVRPRIGRGKGRAGGEQGGDADERRPKGKGKPLRLGVPLDVRCVLGHLWRGCVFHALGIGPLDLDPIRPEDDLARRLFRALEDAGHAGELADLILGWDRDDYRDALGAVTEGRLRLHQRDSWWWVSGGVECLRAVVVDIDLHVPAPTEADREHLRRRIACIARAEGVAEPHLIVGSKRGAHLWFLGTHRSGRCQGPGRDIAGALTAARRLTGCLSRGFAADLPRACVEVFPRSASPAAGMPALPFGPCSPLYTVDGRSIEEAHPLRALAAWHRRHREHGPVRYTLADLGGEEVIVADPSLVEAMRTAPPSLADRIGRREEIRRRHAEQAGDDEDGQPSPTPRRGAPTPIRQGASSPSRPCSADACRAVFEAGPDEGRSNEQGPLAVRWIKFGIGNGADADEEAIAHFLAWVRRGDGTLRKKTVGWWLSKLRAWWRQWELPFTARLRLYEGDVAWAVTQLQPIVAADRWTVRKGLLVVHLCWIALARGAGSDGDESLPVFITARQIRARWDKHSEQYLKRLIEAGLLRLDKPPELPSRQPGRGLVAGRAAEYCVRLPAPIGGRHDIADKAAMLALIAGSLDDTTGAAFARSRPTWRHFVAIQQRHRTAHPSSDQDTGP